jgi:hypothetical protein
LDANRTRFAIAQTRLTPDAAEDTSTPSWADQPEVTHLPFLHRLVYLGILQFIRPQWDSNALFKGRKASMKSMVFGSQMVAIALSAAALCSPAMAQTGKAQLYAFHSAPVVGGCPGLDWHVTLEPDNSLVGLVAWDHGQHIARLEGKFDKNRTFEMNAQEVGGQGRKATVSGKAGGGYISMMINGSGTPCDGMWLNVPTIAGGTGGGGG